MLLDTLQLGRASIDSIVELEVAFEPEWLLTEGTTVDVLREFDAFGPRLIDAATGGLKLTIQSYLLRFVAFRGSRLLCLTRVRTRIPLTAT